MDIQRAKEIIVALADGVNPLTGELLQSSDSCNQPEVVRALHTIIRELEEHTFRNEKPIPENAGNPWTPEEEEQIISKYRGGMSCREIAKLHKRTKGAIQSRLKKLGET
jgi:hypothetical protein